ncbi:MAG: Phosphoribosylformylglycinamidine synthase 1 [candidate division BRC1 bacterium ADurb.BinA364]|nr:MAG: Phosphoribosylformylglycinamidine synthase 1 [candidate division BRC1 bacterium ADurb.BinA364]
MKFGVVVFPGSNCDTDCQHALAGPAGQQADFLWHKNGSIPSDIECVVLPGGFSYGDYLRCGAIARFSPIMAAVSEFAASGRPVIGICNGFQILCEAGLLPGALLKNRSLSFICKDVWLKVERHAAPFTAFEAGVLKIPIAHGEGNFYIDCDGLKRLQDNGQIAFRYCDSAGEASDEANPNGSIYNIAGIVNARGNVLGMMPHPERCAEAALGNCDGLKILESIANSARA